MHLSPSRFGWAFALTLALPALLVGVWAWLEPGGVCARTAAAERRGGAAALNVAAQALSACLARAEAEVGVRLVLDAERRVVGPFRQAPAESVSTPALAEAAGWVRLAAGETRTAAEFLQHAADTHALSPDGWIALARVRGARDPAAGRAVLAEAGAVVGSSWCGNLPFGFVAALAAARFDGADRDASELLREVVNVPAAAMGVACDAIVEARPELCAAPRLAALRVAAAAVLELEWAARSLPAQTCAVPGGVVLVSDARACVLPQGVLADARQAASAAAAAAPGAWLVRRAGADDARSLASCVVPVLAETWVAVPTTTPSSVVLARLARGALVLALVTFLLGNLLLWYLVRREVAVARLRREFVDVVSHELRTPLAALSLRAEMLATGEVPAARMGAYLQAMHHDVRRLDAQVQDVLDFARLERRAEVRAVRLEARALLAQGLRAGRPALRLAGQRARVEAPRGLPPLVGDAGVLARALRNLLENAAKFAPPASTIELRALVRAGMLVVEVADRGPGVPAPEHRAVFEPFRRGAAAGATPGTGLGLAMVAAAARAHGGRVEVRDRAGGGAVFALYLPREAS